MIFEAIVFLAATFLAVAAGLAALLERLERSGSAGPGGVGVGVPRQGLCR